MNPVHWFQFADDAAVITTQESENQHLLNRFSVWCQWSNMFIRVEQCSTFGIKKSTTKSVQFLPKLLINSVLIPTVKVGESFQYLGRYFNFNMSDHSHKSGIISLVEDLMSSIDPNHYIRRINYFYTAAMSCRNYLGILQFLIYLKRG